MICKVLWLLRASGEKYLGFVWQIRCNLRHLARLHKDAFWRYFFWWKFRKNKLFNLFWWKFRENMILYSLPAIIQWKYISFGQRISIIANIFSTHLFKGHDLIHVIKILTNSAPFTIRINKDVCIFTQTVLTK